MAQTPNMVNYVKMTTCAASRCKYAFVDSREHRADRILIGALIPASFDNTKRKGGGWRSSSGDGCAGAQEYELRICSFESKYEAWFLNCMADLAWVLEGDAAVSHEPEAAKIYEKACQELLGIVAAA